MCFYRFRLKFGLVFIVFECVGCVEIVVLLYRWKLIELFSV